MTPTITPTITQTPTPTPPEQIIDDSILDENGDYISVGEKLYLKFIGITPTPTNTSTPTPTPTPTPTLTNVSCSGIPYNLSDIPNLPQSGNTIFFVMDSLTNNPDEITSGGLYFNGVD